MGKKAQKAQGTVSISLKGQAQPKIQIKAVQKAQPQNTRPQKVQPQQAQPKGQHQQPPKAQPHLAEQPGADATNHQASSAANEAVQRQLEADEAARRRRLERFGVASASRSSAPTPDSTAVPTTAKAKARTVESTEPQTASAKILKSGLTCHLCGQAGHIKPHCPQLKAQPGADGAAGKGLKRDALAASASSDASGKTCHLCGQAGHFKRDCPQLKAQAGGEGGAGNAPTASSDASGKTCHLCGQAGHFRRDCPQLKAQAGANGAAGKRPNRDEAAATASSDETAKRAKLAALREQFFEKPATQASAPAPAPVAAQPGTEQELQPSRKRPQPDSGVLVELAEGYAAAKARRLAAAEAAKQQELARLQKVEAKRKAQQGGVGQAKSKIVVLPKLPPPKPTPSTGPAANKPAASPVPVPVAAEAAPAAGAAAATAATAATAPAPVTPADTMVAAVAAAAVAAPDFPTNDATSDTAPHAGEDMAKLEYKCAKYRAKLSAKRADGSGLELPIASPKRKEYEDKLQHWEKLLQANKPPVNPSPVKPNVTPTADGKGAAAGDQNRTPAELKPGFGASLTPLPLSLQDSPGESASAPGTVTDTDSAAASSPDRSAKVAPSGLGFNETGGFQKKILTKTAGGQSLKVEVFMRVPTAPLTARGRKVAEMRRLQQLLPSMQRLTLAALVQWCARPSGVESSRGLGSASASIASCLAAMRQGAPGTLLDLVVNHLAPLGVSLPVVQRLYTTGWTWPVSNCEANLEQSQSRSVADATTSVSVVRKNAAAQQPPRPDTTIVRVRFEDAGALGINFRKESVPPIIASIRPGSMAAAQAPPLRPGLVLSKVGGRSVLTGGNPEASLPGSLGLDAAAAVELGDPNVVDGNHTQTTRRSTRSAPGELLGTLSSVEAEAKQVKEARSAEVASRSAEVASGADADVPRADTPLSYAECVALIKAASRPLEVEFKVPGRGGSPLARAPTATAAGAKQPQVPQQQVPQQQPPQQRKRKQHNETEVPTEAAESSSTPKRKSRKR